MRLWAFLVLALFAGSSHAQGPALFYDSQGRTTRSQVHLSTGGAIRLPSIAAPATVPSTAQIYVDLSTGEVTVKKGSGTVVSLEGASDLQSSYEASAQPATITVTPTEMLQIVLENGGDFILLDDLTGDPILEVNGNGGVNVTAPEQLHLEFNLLGTSDFHIREGDSGFDIMKYTPSTGEFLLNGDVNDAGGNFQLLYGSAANTFLDFDAFDLTLEAFEETRLEFNNSNNAGDFVVREGFTGEDVIFYESATDNLDLGFNVAGLGGSFRVLDRTSTNALLRITDPATDGAIVIWGDAADNGSEFELLHGSALDQFVHYDGFDFNIEAGGDVVIQFNKDNTSRDFKVTEGFSGELSIQAQASDFEIGFNIDGTGGTFKVYDRNGADDLLLEMDNDGNIVLDGQLQQPSASYTDADSPVTLVRTVVRALFDTTVADVEVDAYVCDATTNGARLEAKIVAGANDVVFDPNGTENVEGTSTSYTFTGALSGRTFVCNGAGVNPGWWIQD